MRPDARTKALIIAFDGVFADTLRLRADALAAAARTHDLTLSIDTVLPALPGRTIGECAEHLLSQHDAVRADPTLLELIALAAERAASTQYRSGVLLRPEQVLQVEQAIRSGTRVILRSDARRDDVTPVLALSGVSDVITLRCSDDPIDPRSPSPTFQTRRFPAGYEHTYAPLIRSWRAISQRLDQQQITPQQREAHEAGEEAATVAAAFVRAARNSPSA